MHLRTSAGPYDGTAIMEVSYIKWREADGLHSCTADGPAARRRLLAAIAEDPRAELIELVTLPAGGDQAEAPEGGRQ